MNQVVENQQQVERLSVCMMQRMAKFYIMDENVHGKKSKAQLKEFNRKMQMIFQDPYASLNPRMKVSDIIAEGIDIHGLAKSKKERMTRVMRLARNSWIK